jgi:hypothetical protein
MGVKEFCVLILHFAFAFNVFVTLRSTEHDGVETEMHYPLYISKPENL